MMVQPFFLKLCLVLICWFIVFKQKIIFFLNNRIYAVQEPQIQSLGLLACVSLSDPPHSISRQTLRSRLSLTFSLPVVCTTELSDVALPLHSWQRALALGSRCCPSAAHHVKGELWVPLSKWLQPCLVCLSFPSQCLCLAGAFVSHLQRPAAEIMAFC